MLLTTHSSFRHKRYSNNLLAILQMIDHAFLSAELTARGALAEKEMSRVLEQFRGAPPDPVSVFHELGGILMHMCELQSISANFRSAFELLHDIGILSAGHSHGGSYFIADPELYLSPPSWQVRRRYVDRRIQRGFDALPRIISLSQISFSEWLVLLSIVDLLRTDICTIYFNELMALPDRSLRSPRISACETSLLKTCQLTLELLPDLLHKNGDDIGMILEEITKPPTLSSEVEKLEGKPEWIRSRRASDNTFRVWASLFTLLKSEPDLPAKCWCVGNAFGAIDLGFFMAAALSSLGVSAQAYSCKVGGYPSISSNHSDSFFFTHKTTSPDVIFFCDDSITSGKTASEFLNICHKTFGIETEIRFLLMSYDLTNGSSINNDAQNCFSLAKAATVRAPWSDSSFIPPLNFSCVDDLCKLLLSSPDEKLRWIASAQRPSIVALNKNPLT
jgi:hypothetical protein